VVLRATRARRVSTPGCACVPPASAAHLKKIEDLLWLIAAVGLRGEAARERCQTWRDLEGRTYCTQTRR
jgi:hypothetical protein